MGNGYETETPKGIVGDGRQRNIHVETARALGAGFLEGLLSTPAFLRKEAEGSKTFEVTLVYGSLDIKTAPSVYEGHFFEIIDSDVRCE